MPMPRQTQRRFSIHSPLRPASVVSQNKLFRAQDHLPAVRTTVNAEITTDVQPSSPYRLHCEPNQTCSTNLDPSSTPYHFRLKPTRNTARVFAPASSPYHFRRVEAISRRGRQNRRGHRRHTSVRVPRCRGPLPEARAPAGCPASPLSWHSSVPQKRAVQAPHHGCDAKPPPATICRSCRSIERNRRSRLRLAEPGPRSTMANRWRLNSGDTQGNA